MREPIPLEPNSFFEVKLGFPQRAKDPMEHRHVAQEASKIKDADVAPEDREALAWLREKRATVDLGKAYTIQRYSETLKMPYKDEIPARPIQVEIPRFLYGSHEDPILVSAATLRDVVKTAKTALEGSDEKETYPGRDKFLGRVLAKIGSAELRVADLCALIRDYMDKNASGGALHCSLSDGNMEGNLLWEVDYWRDKEGVDDKAARLIGELLMLMPEDERKALYERGYGR